METNEIKSKAVTGSLAGLLVFFIGTGMYQYVQRNNFEEQFIQEHGLNESLLESNENLQKDLIEVRLKNEDVMLEDAGIKSKNEELNKLVLSTEMNLKKAQATLRKSEAQSAALKAFQNKYNELLATSNQDEIEWNSDKEKFIAQLDELRHQNKNLEDKLGKTKTVSADYFRIEVLKKKKATKQTIRAKKARKLLVSFHWNEELSSRYKDVPVYLQLSGPGISEKFLKSLERVSVKKADEIIQIPVVAKAKIKSVSKGRQEIIMEVNSDLRPGLYQADVYTEEYHLGGAQIRLI